MNTYLLRQNLTQRNNYMFLMLCICMGLPFSTVASMRIRDGCYVAPTITWVPECQSWNM